jgi:hypothetical protein
MSKTTISSVYDEIRTKGLLSLPHNELSTHLRNDIGIPHLELLKILNLPPKVITSADHMWSFELAHGLDLVPHMEKEDAGMWLNEKLASFGKIHKYLYGTTGHLIQKVVERRLEFSDTQLDDAFFTVISEGFLADPIGFLKEIQYKHPYVDLELYYGFEYYRGSLKAYWEDYDYGGLDAYLEKVDPILRRLRYVSDETEEIWTMSSNGTLTIAYLYKYLYGLGYHKLPGKAKKDLIRACMGPKEYNEAWFYCMDLPRKLATAAKHRWASEIFFVHKKGPAAVKWMCSKLHFYVRVHSGLHTPPIYNYLPHIAAERTHYDNVSLNDAFINMHFKCEEVEDYKPCNGRQTKVFSLAMLRSLYQKFLDETTHEESTCAKLIAEIPIPAHDFPSDSAYILSLDICQRLRMLYHYRRKFKEEIRQRELELGALSFIEKYQTKAILEHKDDLSINLATHAEFNDCVVIHVDDEKRFLPKSSLRAFRSLFDSFYGSWNEGPTVLFEGRFAFFPETADFYQLFKTHSSKDGTCGICLDRKSTIGCGNGCTWYSCWDCFHEWFMMRTSCPMCIREYIPLKFRE